MEASQGTQTLTNIGPEAVREIFAGHFGYQPTLIVRSPGRINLIGEHTDYNEGFVLPAAIDKAMWFAVSLQSGGTQARLLAGNYGQAFSFDASAPAHTAKPAWANYLMGVVDQLNQRGFAISGFDCAFISDVPSGAGMSSSAALEGGLAFALNHLLHLNLPLLELARVGQLAEHTYAGVRCGIMDQFANLFSHDRAAIRLDCRSMEYATFPFDYPDVRIVLCNSMVSHSLASSEYNLRRQQCEAGVHWLQANAGFTGSSLRDVSMQLLEQYQHQMDPLVFRRCRHVVGENDRVVEACQALEQHNLTRFGELMRASHLSLSQDYEVSCTELDVLANAAAGLPGVFGSRMMGGGFGGCTINLVKDSAVADFKEVVGQAYYGRFGKLPAFYEMRITQGTSVWGE